MSFSLPNPSSPTNGQLGDATPILQNELAIAQAISSFDGSQINSKSVVESALADSINPRLRGSETFANFVYIGCIWSLVSGLQGTMTGGTIYVNGYRTIVSGVGSNTFAASSDTYVDIDYLGNITYNTVSNNATAPSIIPNAIRVAKVVTNGSAITSVSQAQNSDGIGNIIYPYGANSARLLQNPGKFSYSGSTTVLGSSATPIVVSTTKGFDTGNNVSAGIFTATIAGFYQFIFTATIATSNGVNNVGEFLAYQNGGNVRAIGAWTTGAITGGIGMACPFFLKCAINDTVQPWGLASSGGNSVGNAIFEGFLVSVT